MSNKLQFNISRVKDIFVRRKYKDLLFQRVFREKADLLDLYNAINGTSYTEPDDLEITTLEDAIYMSMKNDKSFIISSTLNLYEHQSTVNPNMPIRGFMYFAKLYEAYISMHKLDIYGRRPINLPTPNYIVFYNGREEIPDKSIQKMSDAFSAYRDTEGFPVLECVATVLNINFGHNERTLNACKRLGDYSQFIYRVNKGLDSGLGRKDAIDAAMTYCIENDILADILIKHRSEVMGSLLTHYDEKLHMKTVRQEGFEDGVEAGKRQSEAKIAEKDAEIDRLKAELERYKKEAQ